MRLLFLPDSLSVVELMREPLVAVLSAGHPLAQGSERGLHLTQLPTSLLYFSPTACCGLYAQLINPAPRCRL